MTKSELYQALKARGPSLPISPREIELIVDEIFDAMKYALARGERIEVRGFGSFKVLERPPRMGRNPKTGEPVQIPARRSPFFKVGKELQERVNGKEST